MHVKDRIPARKEAEGKKVTFIFILAMHFLFRPSHQTLKRCPSGWGKGLGCCPSLRYFIKHICQNKLDNERSFLAKHEAVRPTKYLVWQRNGSKNGVPSFDYLRLVADDNIAVAVFSIV